MLIAIHEVKHYVQCNTRGKVYAHSYTWIEALCSMLFMN